MKRAIAASQYPLLPRSVAGALVFMLLFVGCGGGDDATTSRQAREAAEQKARTATQRLTGTLMGEVQKSIKENGLAGTVTHCANRAQELSTLIGAEEGVEIRRVTEKTRNPLDAPDTYERQILARFADMAARGSIDPNTAHVEVQQKDGKEVLRFLKPIMISKTCLGCHGPSDAIPSDVQDALRAHYPSDLATGYREGDLRGAVSVLVPLSEE
jgi:hypothetical protein